MPATAKSKPAPARTVKYRGQALSDTAVPLKARRTTHFSTLQETFRCAFPRRTLLALSQLPALSAFAAPW